MKVLFYTKVNFAVKGNSGVVGKIEAQSEAFRELGFGCDLVYFEDNKVVIKSSETEKNTFTFNTSLKRIAFQYGGFLKKIDVKSYDLLYVRHFPLQPFAYHLLKQIRQKHPTIKIIIEIPTYPYRLELKNNSIKQIITNGLDDFYWKKIATVVDRILTFSEFDSIHKIPTLKTSNGINISGFVAKKPTPFSQKFHILGLANVQAWHGFDRVIEGIKEYKGSKNKPEVFFHIVGEGNAIPALKILTEKYNLTQNVLFYGARFGDELDTFFQDCHIAVNSLAWHRTGANSPTIKMREYCARGIPFINGYKDKDLPTDFPFAFQVTPDDKPIDIQQLVAFFKAVEREFPNYPTLLYEFAKNNLTWKMKLQVVKEYLK
jgi:glycosyltransferase involved in cell wall biosynthesis